MGDFYVTLPSDPSPEFPDNSPGPAAPATDIAGAGLASCLEQYVRA